MLLFCLQKTTADAIVCAMWKQIISDLMGCGLSQREIADRVLCSQAQISDLYRGERGKRLSFDLGKRLEKLHRQRCKAAAKPA